MSAYFRVAILEDERHDTERLVAELSAQNIHADAADHFERFGSLIENFDFDAAFVDWQIHDVDKGPEALDLLQSEQPTTARIVLTKHEHRLHQAMSEGADYVLFKGGESATRHRIQGESVRLGLARKIIDCLHQYGITAPNQLSQGQFPTPQTEEAILQAGIRVAWERGTRGQDYEQLRTLMVRRGWRKGIDLEAYAKLGWRDKLWQLAGYANASIEDIAQILEITSQRTRVVLGQAVDKGEMIDRSLLERADYLLSALAFVLEISGYDPEFMPHYWNARNISRTMQLPAPWNEMGLAEYLKKTGQAGLKESLIWIRST